MTGIKQYKTISGYDILSIGKEVTDDNIINDTKNKIKYMKEIEDEREKYKIKYKTRYRKISQKNMDL